MSSDKQAINPKLSEIIDCLYRLSAKAVIIRDAKILLTLEHDNDWWSLPGGGIDYGETVQATLSRELSEELGLTLGTVQADDSPLFVTTHAIVDAVPRAVLYYRVELSGTLASPGSGSQRYEWFGANEITNLDLSPSISKIVPRLVTLMQ